MIRSVVAYKARPDTRPARRPRKNGRFVAYTTPDERKATQAKGLKRRRARFARDGRCLQCGGERPCSKHTAQVDKWRKNTGKRRASR